MISFFKRIFKKRCSHKWEIDSGSNVIQLDDMGYPLRLSIIKCPKCGKYEQQWIDSVKREDDVLIKWVD